MIKVKKRELLERSASETTSDDVSSRPKKLKLIIRDRNVYTILDDFEKSSDSNIAISLLCELSTFFPVKGKETDEIFQRLLQVFRMREVDVRSKIIHVLRFLVRLDCMNVAEAESFAVMVLENLVDEDDEECKSYLIDLLFDFHPNLSCETQFFRRLMQELRKLLMSQLWTLRATCLKLLTRLSVKQNNWRKERLCMKSPEHVVVARQLSMKGDGDKSSLTAFDIESTLKTFCDDCDERVRIAATEHIIFLHDTSSTLSDKFYNTVCDLLNDSCSTVRLYGLRLIRILSSHYAEQQVPAPNKSVEIRLVDDAFSKLCNAMHDLSVDVRTEAATLLGTMINVSEKFLEQTLDKKLMSKLKYLKNSEQKSTSHLLSEWSTGRKFGEDAPVEKVDEESASLIPSGACGAFVTGLEDEYLAVRNASISAVCHLSSQSISFANKAMDFLADMFNDEIEDVRLNAIKSLRQLCIHIVLKEDQMYTILNALDDASSDSREALRELLCTCTLHSLTCLKLTIESLNNNMKRYPDDKISIWKCMKAIGLNHPTLVQCIVCDLLNCHPYFDTPEPLVDDQFYISKLVLVLNAASRCPPIKASFLKHTWRHYHYLKNSNYKLVEDLEVVLSNALERPTSVLELPNISERIQQKRIVVIEPDVKSERVLNFVAGLIAQIKLAVIFKNYSLDDLKELRIRISYPNQRQQFQTLRLKDIKDVSADSRRLRMSVFITEEVWTNSSKLEIDFVLRLPDNETSMHCVSVSEKIPVRIYPKSRC